MHVVVSSIYHFSAYAAGNERYTHELALGLVAAGHQVTYLCGFTAPVAPKLPYRLIRIQPVLLLGKPLPSSGWFYPPQLTGVDCFHACGSGLPLLSLGSTYRRRHLPTVLTFQAPSHPQSRLMNLGAKVETALIPHVFSGLITTSPINYHRLAVLYPHTAGVMIPLMVASLFFDRLPGRRYLRQTFGLDPNLKYLIFVARLDHHHYYKGLSILLKSLTRLPENIHLLVIGDGDQLPNYQLEVQTFKLQSRVTFLGAITAKIPGYLKAADLFVFPSTSDSEGFGIALVEAMAVGIPTVTTTVIGLHSLIKDRRLTTFVPPDDDRHLASAIQAIVAHPDPTRVTRAHQFALTLNRTRIVDQTLDFYQQLIDQHDS